VRRDHLFALWCLAMIVVTTVAWWALALWPVPDGGPDWVLRTRAVCFGSTDSGLPAVEGWLLLIFQPLAMTLALFLGWGRPTREALSMLVRSGSGRLVAAVTIVVLVLGVAGSSVRVANAMSAADVLLEVPDGAPADHPRVDRPAPSALAPALVDQSGRSFSLEAYRGQPVLLTFAFARCETVCPVLVREVLEAQRLAPGVGADRPAVVVLTVDPWRDPPSRLGHVAQMWSLGEDAHVVSGPVDAVLAELEAWKVGIQRDDRTGDVLHPALVYVLDRDGRIAFVATAGGQYLAELLARL
jgi:cytochrome oxidase Cu insertion factor (SCO1/SenC/PrrC family)